MKSIGARAFACARAIRGAVRLDGVRAAVWLGIAAGTPSFGASPLIAPPFEAKGKAAIDAAIVDGLLAGSGYERRQAIVAAASSDLAGEAGTGVAASGEEAVATSGSDAPPAEPLPPGAVRTTLGGWEFIVTPLGWAPSTVGDVTVMGLESEVDAKFLDILKHIDFVASLYLEARKDRFFLFSDTLYMEASGVAGASRHLGPLLDRTIGPFDPPGPGGPIGPFNLTGPGVNVDAEVEVAISMLLAELGGGYTLKKWDLGGENSLRAIHLDAIGGARYWRLTTDVDVQVEATVETAAGTFGQDLEASLSGTKEWVDPFGGFRLRGYLTDRFGFLLRGDVGGFGVGSDFTWKATALLHYAVTDHFALYGGYQALGVDYSDGDGFAYDQVMHGPVLGFASAFGGPSRTKPADGAETGL